MNSADDLAFTAPEAAFARLRAAAAAQAEPSTAQLRIAGLRRLERVLLDRRHALAAAISEDFGSRPAADTLLVEVFGVLDELRHAQRRLRRWMRPRRVPVNRGLWPSRAELRYQPLGVVGIIGAFNYPAYLCLSPLVCAWSAGNRVLIKPSEQTPCTATLVRELLAEAFSADEVAVVLGDRDVAARFAQLPFDHLLFTGSPEVGKQIMRAAADNLTPVTLELGGKSPAVIVRGYSIARAARDICHAKLLNAGQTCLAPDYLLIHEADRDAFVRHFRDAVLNSHATLSHVDYGRLISAQAHRRLEAWIEEARRLGAEVEAINPGGEPCAAESRLFAPTLVWNCPSHAQLMQREIFGPVLPIVCYRRLEEAIQVINAGPAPLALYCFCNDPAATEALLQSTRSGGVTINGCLYHAAQHHLPLGGVGQSGIGRYHGFDGFETFSGKRAVFTASRWLPRGLLRPPFGPAFEYLLGLLLHRRLRREPVHRLPASAREPTRVH